MCRRTCTAHRTRINVLPIHQLNTSLPQNQPVNSPICDRLWPVIASHRPKCVRSLRNYENQIRDGGRQSLRKRTSTPPLASRDRSSSTLSPSPSMEIESSYGRDFISLSVEKTMTKDWYESWKTLAPRCRSSLSRDLGTTGCVSACRIAIACREFCPCHSTSGSIPHSVLSLLDALRYRPLLRLLCLVS